MKGFEKSELKDMIDVRDSDGKPLDNVKVELFDSNNNLVDSCVIRRTKNEKPLLVRQINIGGRDGNKN